MDEVRVPDELLKRVEHAENGAAELEAKCEALTELLAAVTRWLGAVPEPVLESPLYSELEPLLADVQAPLCARCDHIEALHLQADVSHAFEAPVPQPALQYRGHDCSACGDNVPHWRAQGEPRWRCWACEPAESE